MQIKMNTLHVNTNHCEFDKATLIGNVKTYFQMGIIFEKKFKSYGRQITGNISLQFKDVFNTKLFNKVCAKNFQNSFYV